LYPILGAAPVLAHAYSLFHKGTGGKAIAVSFKAPSCIPWGRARIILVLFMLVWKIKQVMI